MRRRWLVGLLLIVLMLLATGGASWWWNCLTPDEQFFVGRWEVTYTSHAGQINQHFVDFHSNRTVRTVDSSGLPSRWYANHNQLSFVAGQKIHRLILRGVHSGFKIWNDGGLNHSQYMIIGHDKFISHPQGGTTESRRIVEKRRHP